MLDWQTAKILVLYFAAGCAAGYLLDYCCVRLIALEAVNDSELSKAGVQGHSASRKILTAIGAGILFVLAGIFCSLQAELYFCWFFLSCLLLQALFDYDCQLILDKVSLVLAGAGFFYNLYFQKNLTDMFWGLTIGTGIMLALYWLSHGGMGLGDVKLTAVLGIWLGLDGVLLGLLIAFLTGGVTGMLLLATGIRKRRDAIAFGPFLCIGAAVAMLWGQSILSWYWQFFTLN